jgi:hypothetical protein
MSNKLSLLSSYLLGNKKEYNDYISILNSFYFSELIKVAQQLDNKEIVNESDFGSSSGSDEELEDFLFGSYNRISDLSAKKLNHILVKMKEAFPERTYSDIRKELDKDFTKFMHPDTRNNLFKDPFIGKEEVLKKYIELMPELAWKPEFQQMELKFDNDQVNVKPLGLRKIDSQELNEIYDKIKNDRETEIAFKTYLIDPGHGSIHSRDINNIYNDKNLDYRLRQFILNMFNYEISDDELQNLKHHFEDYIINLRIKKYNLDFGDHWLPMIQKNMEAKQTIFMQEEVNLIEKEIRSTANFLKSLSKEFNKLKSEIVVPDFSAKNESEITSFYDAIVSAAEYYKYIVKKIFETNLDINLFQYNEFAKNKNDLNIEDIIFQIENKTIHPDDPVKDGQAKLVLLDDCAYRVGNQIKNIRKFKRLSMRLDKDLRRECLNRMSLLLDEQKKSIKWLNTYRIDLIRGCYVKSIYDISSSIDSEREKYSEVFKNSPAKDWRSESIYDDVGMSLFRYSTNQKVFISNIVSELFLQIDYAKKMIGINVIRQILFNIVNNATDRFEQKYFNLPINISLDNDVFEPTFQADKRNNVITAEKLEKFIINYDGSHNLKSYINVIVKNTGNTDLIKTFVNNLLIDNEYRSFFDLFIGHIRSSKLCGEYFYGNGILKEVISENTDSEDEIIRKISEKFNNSFFELIEESFSKTILQFASFRHKKSGTTTNIVNQRMGIYNYTNRGIPRKYLEDEFNLMLLYMDNDYKIKENVLIDDLSSFIIQKIRKKLILENGELFSQYELNDIVEVISKMTSFLNDPSDEINLYNKIKKISECISIVRPYFDKISNIKLNKAKEVDINSIPIFIGSTYIYPEKQTGTLSPSERRVLSVSRNDFSKEKLKITIDVNGEAVEINHSDINYLLVSPSLDQIKNEIEKISKLNSSETESLNDGAYIFKDILNRFKKNQSSIEDTEFMKILFKNLNLDFKKNIINHVIYVNHHRMAKIFDEFFEKKYGDINFVNNLEEIVDRYNKAVIADSFSKTSASIQAAFGGVGFKNISSGVEDLFARNNINGAPKKEIIRILTSTVNDSMNSSKIDIQFDNEKYLKSKAIYDFLNCVSSKSFDNIASFVINKLNIKDIDSIFGICIQITDKLTTTGNFSEQDLEKSKKLTKIDNLNYTGAVTKILKNAAFIHNNSSLKDIHLSRLVNSPNFESDSTISREYINGCISLFKLGGIEKFYDENSEVFKLIKKLHMVGVFEDIDSVVNDIKIFSNICMKKDGVRANLGNQVAEVKMTEFVNSKLFKINQDGSIGERIVISSLINDWETLKFEDMVDTIKGILEKIITEKSYADTFFSALVMTIFDETFDKKVDEIRRNSSSQAQYNRDLVVKRKIQKATTYFKIIEESGNLIKYMDGAIKKDRRLFNFEYTDKDNLFRFRVLRDGDPYHFSVGVDTACCQRIGGAGENAAIDSFQNPLAGVLLLEFNINGSWVTGAQSYFHYVPKQNGIILDNVETNNSNCSKFFANKNYTLNDMYNAAAVYFKDKNKLEYVRCGINYNKLSNSQFTRTKISGSDPRHFQYSKYTDFSASSHIDLLKPNFENTLVFV